MAAVWCGLPFGQTVTKGVVDLTSDRSAWGSLKIEADPAAPLGSAAPPVLAIGRGGESMFNLIHALMSGTQLQSLVQRVRDDEKGQTFVEYALVIGGISIVLLAAFAGLSGPLGGVVPDITNALGA